jgi:hypothetical protein
VTAGIPIGHSGLTDDAESRINKIIKVRAMVGRDETSAHVYGRDRGSDNRELLREVTQ